MEESPSWDANRFASSQEISRNFGTRIFITAITSALHLSLSWSSSIHSIPPHQTSWRSILILSSHPRLCLPNGLFPSGVPTQTLFMLLLSPIRATCPAHLILLDFITRTNLDEEYKSLSSSLCSFLHTLATSFPLRPKYSPHHPILKHPQPTFLPRRERPRFTPIKKYISLYVNLEILG